MTQSRRKLTVFGVTALAVLLLDQLSKFWIRTTPDLHDYTLIEGWLAFNFTKNPGMALGIHWADTWVISLVAIAATVIILIYVWKTMKPANLGYMACMGLIVGGALGNITDRIFMARVGGYGGVLDGHVVDFIHFKLRIGDFDVFPYIFNVADMAISVSIMILIVFYKQLMPEFSGKREDADGDADTGSDAPAEPKNDSAPDSDTASAPGSDTDSAPDSDADSAPEPDGSESDDSEPDETEKITSPKKESEAPSRDSQKD